MSDYNERNSMSGIIRAATRRVVDQTQEAVRRSEGADPGADFVTIMVNGKEVKLNRFDYEQLKQKNKEVHLQMKDEIRSALRRQEK